MSFRVYLFIREKAKGFLDIEKTTYLHLIYIFRVEITPVLEHDYCFYLSSLFVDVCVNIIGGVTPCPYI